MAMLRATNKSQRMHIYLAFIMVRWCPMRLEAKYPLLDLSVLLNSHLVHIQMHPRAQSATSEDTLSREICHIQRLVGARTW